MFKYYRARIRMLNAQARSLEIQNLIHERQLLASERAK